jgi:hypothetical protein
MDILIRGKLLSFAKLPLFRDPATGFSSGQSPLHPPYPSEFLSSKVEILLRPISSKHKHFNNESVSSLGKKRQDERQD